MDVGSRIKKIREKRGLTQKELAEKAGVGIATIQNYEKKKVGDSVLSKTLNKIANALDVYPFDLAGNDFEIEEDVFESDNDELNKFDKALNTVLWVSDLIDEDSVKDLIKCGFTAKEAIELDLLSNIYFTIE